jgi:hypothetical protein
MTKIYVYGVPTGTGSGAVHGSTVGGDVIAYALAEDGEGLASHYCSSMSFAKHDIGLTSDWKHDIYKKRYPDGYELEWIDYEALDSHEGFQKALESNRANAEDSNEVN